MSQKGWIFDASRCVGCRACVVACKMENNTPTEVNYRWVYDRESGVYPNPAVAFTSMACFHCVEPACIPSCPVSAITKDADGLVLIDESSCIGCKYCMAACPYGAPQYNQVSQKVEKCTYCIARTSVGLNPACVQTCVGGALQITTDDVWGGTPPEGFEDPVRTQPAVKFL